MKKLTAVYLFNGSRQGVLEKIERGESPHTGFWGMSRLETHGIDATYLELEQYYSPRMCAWMRRHIPIYFVHMPFFFKLFSYDIVYTSSAFGTQFFRSLWPGKKPLWVMQDFSITGILGNETTFKQKLFRFLVQRSAGIVTVGKREEELLKARFPDMAHRIRYITFGTDLSFFTPQNVPEEGYVLAVGFDPDRDWKTLVEATKTMSAKVIIATRPTRVQHLLPLPAHVELATYTPRELVQAYAKAALVVVPLDTSKGINDAMGCSTLFEGMAMGKAVVVTRTHTLETYIDGTNGVLVPEGDTAAMRTVIESLLANPTKRKELGQNAHVYAAKYLDDVTLAGELAIFFRELVVAQK
jgi:glycosyltransferase involved in cell wall biosynthesis